MPDSPAPAPKPRSRFRKWLRRGSIALALLAVVLVVGAFAARSYFRITGERALAAETTRLDAEDPNWRLDDLLAVRAKAAPADETNSAIVVRRVRELTPPEWDEWVKGRPVEEPHPLDRRYELSALTRDDALAAATRPARDLGLTLRDRPHGYHAVTVGDEPFVKSLDETIGARYVANLLRTDAVLAAHDGDAVRGLQAARATLNVGRSIGDEPTIISALARYTCALVAVEAALRVLSLTNPKDATSELAALQAALLAEADEPILANVLRGERAIGDRYLGLLQDGTLGVDDMLRAAGMKPEPAARVSFYFRRGFLPEDRRRFLQLSSDLVAAAKGPPHERLAAADRVESHLRANWDTRYPFHRLLLPASSKAMEASVRHRAELLSAAALIACEQFRLKHDRWPNDLAELPKDLLAAVPTDPYTGAPMKFAKLEDGIAVYSAGGRGYDRDAKRLTNPLGGTESGWRLYDPRHRNLPPLPPKADPPADPDAMP